MEAGTFGNTCDWVEPLEEGTCYAEAALWSNWLHRGTASPSIGGCIMLTINVDSFAAAVQHRRLVRDLIFEYAVAFCRCLQEHIGTVTDCDMSHTSYDDVILSVSDCVRVFLGMAACAILEEQQHVARWTNGVFDRESRSSMDRLAEEVSDSRSCVIVTPDGEVQRLVALACVRIERSDDRRIFVHLGKVTTDESESERDGSQEGKWRVIPWCALPGTKMKDGEQVSGIFSRLITDAELQMFGTSLRFEMETKDVEWQWSKRYGIFTKYIRNVQHCQMPAEELQEELPLTVKIPCLETFPSSNYEKSFMMKSEPVGMLKSKSLGLGLGLAGATIMDSDVMLSLGNPRGPYISAWMTPQNFEVMRKPSSEPALQRWLDSLPIERVLSETMTDWGVANIAGNASYV